jgi:hypothetical protein
MTVGFGLVVRNASGVGSRFRATTNHMENASTENDSRPLPQNATLTRIIHKMVDFPCKSFGNKWLHPSYPKRRAS